METKTKNNLYEGMFLVDSAVAASNWDGINNTIKTILEKADAEVVSVRKWDDRKLAYEIRRVSRGVYLLCYFRANGEKIQEIEHAVQLSEQIMRVLILNAEHMTTEDIEKDTPAAKAEKEKLKTDDESDKDKQAEQKSSPDDSGDVKEPAKTDEAEQAPEDEIKQAQEDEVKQAPEDEVKQTPEDEVKQAPEDEIKQDSEEKTGDEESEPSEISKD